MNAVTPFVPSEPTDPVGTAAPGKVGSKELAAYLSAPTARLTRRLGIAGFVALIVVALWATLVPIASGAVATGRLEVEDRRKTIQHLDGGIISRIAVQEGQHVTQGQLLIGLDDGDARLDVATLQSQSDSLRAEQAAREAELAGLPSVHFPADLLARASEIGVAATLRAQRSAFEARRLSARGQQAQLGEKVNQLGEDRQGAVQQSAARAAQIALLDREIRDTQMLVDRGYSTRPRLYSLQRAAEALRGEQGALDQQVTSLRAQSAQTRIQSAQVERERSSSAADALRSVQNELVQVTEKLSVARQVLARKAIRAPVAGTVVGMSVSTLGGVVRPGEALMDIVPSAPRLIVRAQLSPLHADDVHAGQKAYIRFEGLGVKKSPTIEGTVEEISADSLVDAHSGARFFEILVSIPRDSLNAPERQLLRPGLPADVLIKTGERTAVTYLMAPITRAAFHSMRE